MVRLVPVALEDKVLRAETLKQLPELPLPLQQAIARAFSSASDQAKPAIGAALNALGADHPALREVAVGGETAERREDVAAVWDPVAYRELESVVRQCHSEMLHVSVDVLRERLGQLNDWLDRLTDRSDLRNFRELSMVAVALSMAGRARRRLGDVVGTLAMYGESLALLKRIEIASRGNPVASNNLASALVKLGQVERDLRGDRDAAHARFREALTIWERIADGGNGREETIRIFARVLHEIALLEWYEQGNPDSAEALLRRSLGMHRAIVESVPNSHLWRLKLSEVLHDLGFFDWIERDDFKSARVLFQASLRMREDIVKQFGTSEAILELISYSALRLDEMDIQGPEDIEAAHAYFDILLQNYQKRLDLFGEERGLIRDRRVVREWLAKSALRLGRPEEALEHMDQSVRAARRVTELIPDSAVVREELHDAEENLRHMKAELDAKPTEVLDERAPEADEAGEETGGESGEE